MEQLVGVSHKLSDGLYYYEREDTHTSRQILLDTLGAIWMLAWLEDSTYPIEIYRDHQWMEFPKDHLLFMPPYSILKWKLGPGLVRWKAFVSYSHSQQFIDSESFLIPGKMPRVPESPGEVLEFVESAAHSTFTGREPVLDLGAQLKLNIDTTYREGLLMEELAKKFDISRVSLFRHFKSRFGFSPTQYRQRLRLFEAIRLVNLGESMTRAVFESGFSDLSEFYKQFRHVFYCSPSQFIKKGQSSNVHLIETKLQV